MIWIYAGLWLLSGLWFWIAAHIWNGWPDCWHARSNRGQGWDEAIFFYLPICLAFGAVLWLAKAVYSAAQAVRG